MAVYEMSEGEQKRIDEANAARERRSCADCKRERYEYGVATCPAHFDEARDEERRAAIDCEVCGEPKHGDCEDEFASVNVH